MMAESCRVDTGLVHIQPGHFGLGQLLFLSLSFVIRKGPITLFLGDL